MILDAMCVCMCVCAKYAFMCVGVCVFKCIDGVYLREHT